MSRIRRRYRRHSSLSGLTIIEVLLVIAIIGLLIALLLPAIQYGREAARRTTCSSNLRQISIGVANYESVHSILPPGASLGKSLFVNLLPYLEHTDLANKVDYSDPLGAEFLQSVVISTYLCPSDSVPRLVGTETPSAGTNYAGSSGVWSNNAGFKFNGLFRTLHDFSPYDYGPIPLADVTDGLGNTAGVAEILRSDGSGRRLRVPWELPRDYGPGEIEGLAAACRGLPEHPPTFGWIGDYFGRGTPWHRSGFANTLYSHVLGLNEPSCLNRQMVPSAASTASSQHVTGVFVAFADGHVRFVNEQIDVRTWRRFGGRNDGQ